jgi:hypothetical protein
VGFGVLRGTVDLAWVGGRCRIWRGSDGNAVPMTDWEGAINTFISLSE